MEDSCWTGGAWGCQNYAEPSCGVLPYQCRGTLILWNCCSTNNVVCIPLTNWLTVLLALACLGAVRDIWECEAGSEQSPWEYSNWSAHLDHSCQVGGGQWQHTDGGEDHWPSNHLTEGQWGRDQPWAVDSGQSWMLLNRDATVWKINITIVVIKMIMVIVKICWKCSKGPLHKLKFYIEKYK